MPAPPRISLDVVRIESPCPLSFEQFPADAQPDSFCHACGKRVHNLSAMPRRDAEALLASGTDACVVIERDITGRVGTLDYAPSSSAPWTRWLAPTLLGCFVSTMLLAIGIPLLSPIRMRGGVGMRSPATQPAEDAMPGGTDDGDMGSSGDIVNCH